MVYERAADVDFEVDSLPEIPAPRKVLLTSPTHFQVKYVINPHMEGNVGEVDMDKAMRQWDAVARAYESCGVEVVQMDGEPGLPDMVFCANQSLPYVLPESEKKGAVLSHMYAIQRRPEVEHYGRFFNRIGYEVMEDPFIETTAFEGMGDAMWHAGRFLLWGGYGIRTNHAAYGTLSSRLGVRIAALRLDDPVFYHLDTCFCVLDSDHVLMYPGAFTKEGCALIRRLFRVVIEAPENEARDLFACNAHCPDARHVIIQRGCTVTNARLLQAGFEPIEVDTDEFLKAGGSVFCMKQMFW